ncbi:uncharacterized protein LOC126896914 isoform X2 [Daktulosphaira vitifoliae]|uniref:uncharacterized protein LOC126896914 isoform X2 n=1 Tax=Daktulosphaira vitifoliae TaxID=58002 RepID=UPI0021AA5290|nr:uncharacterized protein LOC126896914 isoform X2 [Daktulosphaira vitifoliae]
MQRAHIQDSKNVPKGNKFGFGPNMCYVNCNLPRALPMNHQEIKKLIKDGNIEKLEEKLLNGEGYKLIGLYSTNPKVKIFLQSVPIYMARIDMLQESGCKGNLRDMQVLLNNENSFKNSYKISSTKLACSKDLNGVSVLHKAVYYDFPDIVEWLVKDYPQTVHVKDKTNRIPLHYICSCSEVHRIWDLMLEAGADPNSLDINNKTPLYYLECKESINWSNTSKTGCSDNETPIKPSNIRIWIHERNIQQLSRVIWSGFGDKLLTETSQQSAVNKFLKAVPYILGIIKETHKAVIDNDIVLLKKLSRDPVPKELLASKDKNGLTPLHKAIALGRIDIVEYILYKHSKAVNIKDNEGRTPLHYVYCAPPKDFIVLYNRLLKAGANENLIDKQGNIPKNYSSKTNHIPDNIFSILPKAPRISSEFPASWDWSVLYNINQREKRKTKFEIRSTSDISKSNLNEFSNFKSRKTNILDIHDDSNNILSTLIQMKSEINNEVNDSVVKPKNFKLKASEQYEICSSLDDNLSNDGLINKSDDQKDTNNNVNANANVVHNDMFDASENKISERNSSAKVLVKNGSLNKIADYILDGKYVKLLGIQSDDSTIQEFLNKVPFYANKIEQIHRCCAIGDMKTLSEILDRRKFCLARESKTGLGLTPLHVAAIYEQLNIFGYLAARFPETLKSTDFKGRTPMDYINLLPDKTLFNALIHSDNNLKSYLTGHHALQSLGDGVDVFEPEKIRKDLGFVAVNIKDDNCNFDMDRLPNNSGKILSSVMSANRYSNEDRKYLTNAIGKPLSSGLKELVKRRPSNPTLHLADYLSNYSDDQQLDKDSGVVRKETQLLSKNLVDSKNESKQDTKPWEYFNKYYISFKSISRDEFGMNMLHYAASRVHNRNAFFQLLQDLDTNIGVRDELYRTPRDIAINSNLRENVQIIDKYVVHIIARGEHNKIIGLLLEGYGHILDLETDKDIMSLATDRGHSSMLIILQYIPTFEDRRERLHRAIRLGSQSQVDEMLKTQDEQCVMLSVAKNQYGRCSMHLAVLSQNEEIVRLLGENFPTVLNVPDNMERTALHYAMAIDKVETMSNILIRFGANRTAKDLKGRQPSYYFINKFEIKILQKEEDELRV